MNRFMKTALAVFAFSHGVVFAGSMGPVCIEKNATIPCPGSAWAISAQALYLHPSYSSFFATTSYTNTIANTTQFNIPDPLWGWGFKLAGAYYYQTGSDVNINWYHYNHITNNYPLVTPLVNGVPGTTYAVTTTIKPRWDAVNGELGQLVKFGDFKKIRFHGGAQYAQIISNLDSTSSAFPVETLYMKFLGFGPRIGADMSYDWNYGLSVYANGAGALLVGGSKFNYVTTGLANAAGMAFMPYNTVVIPELEGKLGATYTYAVYQGSLSLDVGYLWQNYINSQVFRTVDSNNAQSDFMLNGPYVGLKWLG